MVAIRDSGVVPPLAAHLHPQNSLLIPPYLRDLCLGWRRWNQWRQFRLLFGGTLAPASSGALRGIDSLHSASTLLPPSGPRRGLQASRICRAGAPLLLEGCR